MVTLKRRNRPIIRGNITDDVESKVAKSLGGSGTAMWTMGLSFLLCAFYGFGFKRSGDTTSSFSSSLASISGSNFIIDSKVKLIIKFEKNGSDSEVSLGSHRATLLVDKSCRHPGFALRLEGDALVGVILREHVDRWIGSFSLPVDGSYSLVAFWNGCDGKGKQKRLNLKNITAKGSIQTDQTTLSSMFPAAAWISPTKFTQEIQILQPYLWHNPQIPPNSAILLKSVSVISQESTTGSLGFFDFKSLSNYELVCFIGSDSAESLRTAFLDLRSLLFPHQRPFKFHIYPIHSFVKPDHDWEPDTKTRFRKCKHILISLDEMTESVSQQTYKAQVKTFINHLLKAFPDETFPIWMFTVSESPLRPTNCHSPSLGRSSEHPCNVALKNLFQEAKFSNRVHLLDNTDISFPQLGENAKDVATAIALRIFVLVGKQVETWRKSGQVGTVDGLVRGDKTEPNFELVPYNGWS